MAMAEAEVRKPIPFDVNLLDRLLDDAGIDVLIATSKHNVQYLLGDYKFFFFEAMDAIGVGRYLPAVVYQKGKPERAGYVGNSMEAYEMELGKFWPQNLYLSTWTGADTMQRVLDHIAKLGPGVRRVGIEAAFLPVDAEEVLRRGLSNVDIVDALNAKGFSVEKSMIRMPSGPLKHVGDHPVTIVLHADVTAHVTVTVIADTTTV